MDDSCYHLGRQDAVRQGYDLQPYRDGWCGDLYCLRYPSLRMVDGAKVGDTKVGEDDSGCCDDGSGGDGGDDCSSRSSSADSNHSSMECANSGMDDTNSRMATPSHNTNCMQGQRLHPTSQTSRLHT